MSRLQIENALQKLAKEITRRSKPVPVEATRIELVTAKAKLGGSDIHFTGYLSVKGPVTLLDMNVHTSSAAALGHVSASAKQALANTNADGHRAPYRALHR